jgi:hypothetical protein
MIVVLFVEWLGVRSDGQTLESQGWHVKAVGISEDLVPSLCLPDFDTLRLYAISQIRPVLPCSIKVDAAQDGHRPKASLFHDSFITFLYFSITHPAAPLFFARSEIHCKLTLELIVVALLLGGPRQTKLFRASQRETET